MSKSKRKMTYKDVIKYFKKRKHPKTDEQLAYLASLKNKNYEGCDDICWYYHNMPF